MSSYIFPFLFFVIMGFLRWSAGKWGMIRNKVERDTCLIFLYSDNQFFCILNFKEKLNDCLSLELINSVLKHKRCMYWFFLNFSCPVPGEYFAHLDASGRRVDMDQRPELLKGNIEFIAPAEYMVRPPMPPSYFFLIDVSISATKSGMLEVTYPFLRKNCIWKVILHFNIPIHELICGLWCLDCAYSC